MAGRAASASTASSRTYWSIAEANDFAAEFLRGKIRAQVRDPEVAALLTPRSVVGCKRICLDTDYFATFNRPDVTLVDVSAAPIEEITRTGLRTGGDHYELDTIVFAIGFDAMTGPLLSIDVRGRGGRPLRAKWAEGPRTYLGLAIEGFPNLFTITGPTSPSVLASMVPAIEQHVEWIADCIAHAREHAHARASRQRARQKPRGSPITTRRRAARSSPPATPGTSAPMSTESRAR